MREPVLTEYQFPIQPVGKFAVAEPEPLSERLGMVARPREGVKIMVRGVESWFMKWMLFAAAREASAEAARKRVLRNCMFAFDV